ncbi:hypothetical protein Pmar_PMAR027175 [Perkinsus marinus ATCC 50983]|uniref:Uncharacterized protein n=3 Tax=Perkinsus marinus (strain ATCC 50983 / TXsc) TaxID=423536 RepID=C5KUE5_PERM5|nr:hypothetical protein Pmar_PMAR027175 [Perkinsus marinus ATCC 50983]EER11898.1 hypothetical protein Pmar_PMAR027175 [Perkinsus marinus ATCC 50983]|eukprot:XP_002780103.1 hypothetical protein Pmar_PMAR027175 [Perkinsus marinus ATCC 50983]
MIICAATYRIWTRTLCTKSSAEVATVLGELLDEISPSVCLVDGGKEFANLLVPAAAVTPNDLYLSKGSTTLLPGGAADRPLSPAAEHFIEAFEAIPPSELASKVNNNVAQVAAAVRESLGISLKLYQANWELRRAASRRSWALSSVGRRVGPIELGSWVYVWRPSHYKIATNWMGPARVMAVRPADTYLVYWLGLRDDGADGRSSTESGYNLMPIRQATVLANLNDRYNKIILRAAAVQRALSARQQIVRQPVLPTPQDIYNAAAPNSLLYQAVSR